MNQRFATIGFTEQVLEKLLNLYQYSMDEDTKVVLLKIMHIAIAVHSPETVTTDESGTAEVNEASHQNDDLFKTNVAENAQLWHKHLRNMFGIVEREIRESRKRPTRYSTIPSICHTFVQVAAKLCSVVCITFEKSIQFFY